MTSGSPARLLLVFSMPLMLGNLFQQLYTFVDAVIVGRCVSANALAALGATEWLTFIMFGVIQGITQGCSVVIASCFGQKKMDLLKRAIYSGCLIAALGAAAFTIIGQIVITPMLEILHTPPEVFDLTQTYLRILYAGVPVTVNGFGVLFLTGYAAANKLYVLLEIAATSYGHGTLTYTAQNKGAGSDKRVREGLKAALLIGAATALIMSGIMFFAGRQILGLFISQTETGLEEMLRIGYRYLCVLALGFPLLYCLYVLRACMQGMGDAVSPMLSSLMQVFMRVTCALLLTRMIGQTGVFWGEVFAWVGADAFLGIVCARRIKKG